MGGLMMANAHWGKSYLRDSGWIESIEGGTFHGLGSQTGQGRERLRTGIHHPSLLPDCRHDVMAAPHGCHHDSPTRNCRSEKIFSPPKLLFSILFFPKKQERSN